MSGFLTGRMDLCLLVFCLCSELLHGQSQANERFVPLFWSRDQGAPMDRVNGVIEGSDGFLWLATYEGLIRFDGHQYRIFNHQINPDLVGGIRTIIETSPSTYFMISANGMLLRLQNGQFTRWSTTEGFDPAFAEALVRGPGETIVMAGSHGFLTLDETDQLVPFPTPNLEYSPPTTFVFDEKSRLWIAPKEGGLVLWEEGRTQTFNLEKMGGEQNRTNGIFPSADGNLWLGMINGVGLLDPESGILTYFPAAALAQGERRFRLSQGSGQEQLGGTTLGNLHRMSPEGIRPFEIDLAHRGSPENIYKVIELRKGGFAIATHSMGLLTLIPSEIEFYNEQNGLRGSLVNTIQPLGPNRYLVGHNQGIDLLEAGRFTPFEMEGRRFDTYVVDILVDSQDRIWIATFGEGLFLFNGKEWEVFNREGGMATNTFRTLAEAPDGSIWIGSREGLYRWKDGMREYFDTASGLRTNYILSLAAHDSGDIWVGTARGGLHVIREGTVDNLDKPEWEDFRTRTVFGMSRDRNGAVWGGMSGGIFRIQNGEPEFLNLFHHLDIESVFHILDDGSDAFWLASSTGFHRLPYAALSGSWQNLGDLNSEMRSFGKVDGLPSDGMRSVSRAFQEDDRSFWIPTNRGIFHFNPRSHHPDPYIPPLYFDDVRLDGESLLQGWFAQSGRLELPPRPGRLRFEFAAPAARPLREIRYRARIAGIDRYWQELEEGSIEYTNLRPGSYVFELKVGNPDGQWSDEPIRLHFTVAAAFYERPWFLLLVGILIFSVGLALSFGRIRYLRWQKRILEEKVEKRSREIRQREEELARQNEKLKQVNDEKNQFMGIAAHDLRSPLATIEGFAECLKEEADSVKHAAIAEMASDILEVSLRMRNLLENLLDVNRIERGEVFFQKVPVSLPRVLRKTLERHHKQAKQKNIRLQLRQDLEVCDVISDEQILTQIMDNFCSNALKFSSAGTTTTLYLETRERSGSVYLGVKDEGPGIREDEVDRLFDKFSRLSNRPTGNESSSGLGLSIARKLAELLGHRVGYRPSQPTGSEFFIEFDPAP